MVRGCLGRLANPGSWRLLATLVVVVGLSIGMGGCLSGFLGPIFAGPTWSLQSTIPGDPFLIGHYMVSSTLGWAASFDGDIFGYNGTDWVLQESTGGNLATVWADSAASCWVGGAGGRIWHFDGTDWTLHTTAEEEWILSIRFLASDNGWAVGDAGHVYHYDGNSWSLYQTASGGNSMWEHDMPSANYGWAVGNGGYAYTFDGASWTPYPRFAFNHLSEIEVVSESEAWTADMNNNIWLYDGTDWSIFMTTADYIRGIEIVASNDGWMADDSGNFYRYDGSTWSLHTTTDEGSVIHSLQMLSQTEGWAVGEFGRVYRYSC